MPDPTTTPKLAYNQAEAAKQLGIGVNNFKDNVRPHIKSVWIGNARRYPHVELQKWLDKNAQGL